MKQPTAIFPETEDECDAENNEQIADPHGENLRWSKRVAQTSPNLSVESREL